MFWTHVREKYGSQKEDLVWKTYPVGCFLLQVKGWPQWCEHVLALITEECTGSGFRHSLIQKLCEVIQDSEILLLSSVFHPDGFLLKLILSCSSRQGSMCLCFTSSGREKTFSEILFKKPENFIVKNVHQTNLFSFCLWPKLDYMPAYSFFF